MSPGTAAVAIGVLVPDPVVAQSLVTDSFVTDVLLTAAAAFVVVSIVAIYRVVRGPTMPDRVIAVNVVGSNTVIVIALLAAALGEPGALDIALVYALLNFLLSIAISKFTVERGGVL